MAPTDIAATTTAALLKFVLARAGDRVDRILVVLAGEVRLIRRDPAGNDIVLQRSRGGFLAEASASSGRYHCDVEVAESGALLGFPLKSFQSALDKDASFRNGWIVHLAREVRRLRAQCERLNLRHAADRVLHYIECEGSNGTLMLSCSRRAWAAERGMTHESLYRTLAQLQDSGTAYSTSACNLRPRAFATFKTVAKLGLPVALSAL
ncbi:MAG: Crp/Fnr family transcriptional regulator [Pseudomonadota bacterium]|nr:Crp/Fnr family transcriptional regulator [Pseudomonadota bacterium]